LIRYAPWLASHAESGARVGVWACLAAYALTRTRTPNSELRHADTQLPGHSFHLRSVKREPYVSLNVVTGVLGTMERRVRLSLKSEVATRAARKAVDSKDDKIFSYSLLCCHRPTSPKLKRSLKKVTDLPRILHFNFGIWVKPLAQPRKRRLRFGSGVSCNEVHVILEIAMSSAFCSDIGTPNRRMHAVCRERSGRGG
jgi:hypothetical protein